MSSELVTVTVVSSVPDAVSALKKALETRGIEVFATIDHAAGARQAGLELEDEVVVIFGNPAVGTHLMQDDPAVGLDLPLRMLFWRHGGETRLAYTDPHAFAERFALVKSKPILDALASLLATLADEVSGAGASDGDKNS